MIKFFKTDENKKLKALSEFEVGCWVDLINPSDDEVEDVCLFPGMPEEMLKAALDEQETARFERDDEICMYLFDTPIITDTDDRSEERRVGKEWED